MKFINATTRLLFLAMILAMQTPFQALGGSSLGRSTAKPAISPADVSFANKNLQLNALTFTPAAFAGTRRTVCAQTLKVRGEGAPGIYIGELDRGETFLVTREGSVWAYGFAYGRVNKWGHVMKKYLC